MTHSYSATNFLSAEDKEIEDMIRDLPEGSGMKGKPPNDGQLSLSGYYGTIISKLSQCYSCSEIPQKCRTRYRLHWSNFNFSKKN